MTICIGNIKLPSQVLLAPMSGVTDLPYRKLVKSFGAGLVVSEMVASRAMIELNAKALKKSSILDEDTGACVQIAGCDPYTIAESAKIIESQGAKIIDLNFGCPAKKVVGGYAGSALMRDEKLATQILETTVKAVPNTPVTLKMRLGWDENNKNAPILAKIAENAGIRMITVHGRTRSQFYTGKADWKFIAFVKNSVKIPVIANGDIIDFESAIQALSDSGADGIMIGRGCYGKPWLLAQIHEFLKTKTKLSAPSITEQAKIVLAHYDLMLEYYGKDTGLKMARKHLGWYSTGLANSGEFRASINQMNNIIQVKDRIFQFYSSLSQQQTNYY